jgi:HlyD family secretion protein
MKRPSQITVTIQTLILVSNLLFLISCGKKDVIYDASGIFEATEIMVSSEGTGKIIRFDIVEGQHVKTNELLGQIDTVQLSLKKLQLMATIKAMQSRRPEVQKQIAAIQQQISTSKSELLRFEKLVKANAANQKQLDDLNAQVAVLEKQVAAQKSSLEIANRGISEDVSTLEIQVAQIDDLLQKCRICSPIEGTILLKYAEAGELANTGRALCKVADMENLYLRTYLTSDQLSQVKLGQIVSLFADFGSNSKEYSGTIIWISDKSEFTPKTIQTKNERANLVYAVKISVKNDGYLKLGMYGQVKFNETM